MRYIRLITDKLLLLFEGQLVFLGSVPQENLGGSSKSCQCTSGEGNFDHSSGKLQNYAKGLAQSQATK